MTEYNKKDWIYDLETYPNVFTMCVVRADGKFMKVYEISDYQDDTEGLLKCFRYLRKNDCRLVGFNNIGFDYPVIHYIMEEAKSAKLNGHEFEITAEEIYDVAQAQIDSFKGDGFGHTIKADAEWIKQVDLFKIHHFDNKARATSLKMLEFNMRSDQIEDLPYEVGTVLTEEEIQVLKQYNQKDVMETLKFYRESLGALKLRAELSEKYGMDLTNHNDTKIGKDYFISVLEKRIPGSCYEVVGGYRKMRQTRRKSIDIGDCLFDYYDFVRPEFQAVLNWFSQQKISETKGVFSDIDEHNLGDLAEYAELTTKRKKFPQTPTESDIKDFLSDKPKGWIEQKELKALTNMLDENGNVVYELVELKSGKTKEKPVKVPKVSHIMCHNIAETLNTVSDGFRFDFGTGGIHGSLHNAICESDEEYIIIDCDVASMYPNIAIANRVYPEHLGENFCDIYLDVYKERKGHAKGTPENAALKLALNGVYGDSNNQYSPFYDPKYTMTITINGQLSLLYLSEMFLEQGFELIQCNTDGVTCKLKREHMDKYYEVCKEWENITGLELEYANYDKMIIRDVNNYIAIFEGGDYVKRKGAYEYENLGWHQNHSALVIPMAAEAVMVHGQDLEEFVRSHKNEYDFMLRTKVPRSSRLVLQYEDGFEKPLQNTCRYYPSTKGGRLVKIMPPLPKKPDEERRIGIDKEYLVRPCNDMSEFNWDIDYEYYMSEARKLIIQAEDES